MAYYPKPRLHYKAFCVFHFYPCHTLSEPQRVIPQKNHFHADFPDVSSFPCRHSVSIPLRMWRPISVSPNTSPALQSSFFALATLGRTICALDNFAGANPLAPPYFFSKEFLCNISLVTKVGRSSSKSKKSYWVVLISPLKYTPSYCIWMFGP